MSSNNLLTDLLKDLPETLGALKRETEKVGKTILESQLQKTDFVTREEFEEQKQILKAVLDKLNSIEIQLN